MQFLLFAFHEWQAWGDCLYIDEDLPALTWGAGEPDPAFPQEMSQQLQRQEERGQETEQPVSVF